MSNTTIPAQVEPKRKRGRPEGFVAYEARVTGRSKASVKRDLRRGKMICQDARDLIRQTKLDKGAYLDALIKMDLTDEEQVEQVRADLAGDHQSEKVKTKTLRYDDSPEAVADKLHALYDDEMLACIRRAL